MEEVWVEFEDASDPIRLEGLYIADIKRKARDDFKKLRDEGLDSFNLFQLSLQGDNNRVEGIALDSTTKLNTLVKTYQGSIRLLLKLKHININLKRGRESNDVQLGLKKANFGSSVIKLPYDPFARSSDRSRFEYNDDLVQLVNRTTTKELEEFIVDKVGKVRGVYVQGPQGVGKPHSLFHIVMKLRLEKDNRVVYIPDCGGWAGSGNGYEFFLEAIIFAFSISNDDFIDQYLKRFKILNTEESFTEFLKNVAMHCNNKNLHIYTFFDQHNGLSDQDRTTFPYSMPERYLVVSEHWHQHLTVVSGSSNNEYYLKVAKDGQWPIFQFVVGFNDTEFKTWREIESKKQFSDKLTEDHLEEIKYLTNNILIEVNEIWKIANEHKPLDVSQVLSMYKNQRARMITDQDDYFLKEFVKFTVQETDYKRAIFLMDIGAPATAQHSITINQQLMYIRKSDSQIVPIIPLVQTTVKFSNVVRGLALEKYIIEILETLVNKDIKWEMDEIYMKTQYITNNQFEGADWSTSSLLVPIMPNFKAVDWFFWDTKSQTLTCCQATVANSHTNDWKASKVRSNLYKSLTIAHEQFLWITTREFSPNAVNFDKQLITHITNPTFLSNFSLLSE
ncbi:hypothetical protein DFA_06496 [Cavenderia fasciculata]|uniref:Crinkler family protein n=1 Tax=Cavenderia fasciculata TaxID=261658 RepID=F4PJ60_CACFS|nr:uncharacterized protein DFA_06496 [Cavenderia fasciculata]EGG24346.1 hypothetical protein DFA_06496 [Cavenderia fasciculata]|eukprot:XP_004362197.1 hypothetical protein DFA_06496 [Cavenderia fasciculata]